MVIHTINDLHAKQKAVWRAENERYFGITPLHEWANQELVDQQLAEAAKRLWNEGTNEFKELLVNGKCNDIDKMIPGSWELKWDQSGLICLYATFKWEQEKWDGTKEEVTKRAPIAYLPCPDDLCWYLGESRYVLRVTATANYSLIHRMDRVVMYQKAWAYDLDSGEWKVNIEDFDPWDDLTALNREYLSHFVGVKPEELTRELFMEALTKLPEYDARSVYNFRYTHVDEMFRLVSLSKRFANPIMKVAVPINVVKMFTAKRVRADAVDKNGSNNLVLVSNELFALENSRTVIYKNEFNSNFMFTNSERFFDVFKTSTNKSAGKSRLILDDAEVHDGKLWVTVETPEGEKQVDMWEAMAHPEWTVHKNLSVLSSSHFGGNNAPKRIMMTAKLRAQAVPTAGENDSFTHETPARIVFGDWKGFNFGDSIIMSRSFARKLRSVATKKIRLTRDQYLDLNERYKVGDTMSITDLSEVTGSTMCDNYRNIVIQSIDSQYLVVKADLPFSVGDKVTNLHGSKGIVSLILEDNEMPYLEKPIGNFPAGPFDIIVSGMSVYRRKSLGQLFEAWAAATGHTDVDNVMDAVNLYADDLKQFSEQSVVLFGETSTIKPIGINVILRLNHDAVGKQSHSYVKSNYARMLKFGEMELLNLAARGLWNIINEIDVRSVSKHHNSLNQIRQMQKTGEIRFEPSNNLRFFNILRTCGFEFNLREPLTQTEDASIWSDALKLLTDDKVELFGGDNQ